MPNKGTDDHIIDNFTVYSNKTCDFRKSYAMQMKIRLDPEVKNICKGSITWHQVAISPVHFCYCV